MIGGGPAGLAAAITLAKRGVDVTVTELRADENGEKPLHARPHQISLRQDTLDSLKDMGAYDEVMKTSGYVETERMVRTDGKNEEVKERTPRPETVGQTGTFHDPKLLETDSVSQVRISDVERALYNQAKKLGVKVKAGYEAEVRREGDSYGVTAYQVKPGADGRLEKTGAKEDMGTPDLLVVADGAGSPVRDSLGIEMKEESAAKHYLGGHFNKGLGPNTTKAAIQEGGFTRHVMGTGHSKYDQTWVSVEVTKEEAALAPEERTKLLAQKAQHVFGEQPVNEKDVGWGAGQLTTVQNRRAEKAYAGDNTVLIGDAAGTGSVWVGGGLNLALTTHLKALDNLVTKFRTGCQFDHDRGLRTYDKAVQWATNRWHQVGASQLGMVGANGVAAG